MNSGLMFHGKGKSSTEQVHPVSLWLCQFFNALHRLCIYCYRSCCMSCIYYMKKKKKVTGAFNVLIRWTYKAAASSPAGFYMPLQKNMGPSISRCSDLTQWQLVISSLLPLHKIYKGTRALTARSTREIIETIAIVRLFLISNVATE